LANVKRLLRSRSEAALGGRGRSQNVSDSIGFLHEKGVI
jgi:hypothetical protein